MPKTCKQQKTGKRHGRIKRVSERNLPRLAYDACDNIGNKQGDKIFMESFMVIHKPGPE